MDAETVHVDPRPDFQGWKVLLALTLGPLLTGWIMLALILMWQHPGASATNVIAIAGWIVGRLAGPPIGGVLAVAGLSALVERVAQVRLVRPRPVQLDPSREETLVAVARDIVVKMVWLGTFATVVFVGCYLAMMIEGCA